MQEFFTFFEIFYNKNLLTNLRIFSKKVFRATETPFFALPHMSISSKQRAT